MSFSILATNDGNGGVLYTVGTWHPPHGGLPEAQWLALRDCKTEIEAFAFINYLNGGDGKAFDAGWDTGWVDR